MDRAEILAAAQKCVCGERQQDYGTPENSFRVIGELWETYIKEKCASADAQIEIIPEDVAALQALGAEFLRDENTSLLQAIREIEAAYEEAEADNFEGWHNSTEKFDRLLKQLPDRAWVE